MFGREALADPDSVCVCLGDGDPNSFMWSFEWMPHALLNDLNWYEPKIVWAPEGANLTQGGFGIPAATFTLFPATLAAGPVVAYNVAAVLMPVLAAWFAYRLCRYLTGSAGPAFVGGLVFGFGTYMSAHLLGHLNLTSVFLAPAAVLLALQRLDEAISQRRFVVLMALVFSLQLLLSAEILFIGIGVGGLALLLGFAFDAERRGRIARLAAGMLAAGGIAMVVTSPYLYYVLDGLGEADSEGWRKLTNAFAGDALNPIVPTEVTGLGHWWFEDMSSKFSNFTPSEAGGYVGVVLIGIVLAFAVSRWRRPATRVLVGVIVVCFVVSLGTELHVAGENTGIWMPWSLLHPLPLFDHVITSRFWVFALLAIAIAVALWLAEPSCRRAAKWAVAVAGLALLVPNVSSDFWSGRPTERAFFTSDEHERYVREDERVLVLPFTPSSMLWQAETGMAFEMVEGYLSPEPPADYRNDPFYDELVSSEIGGEEGLEELRDFLERREVTAVVVEQKAAGPWPLMLAGLGLTPIKTGGVIFYRVRSGLAA